MKEDALKQWLCEECTHLNVGTNKVCSLCDTPNPLFLEDHLKPLRLPSRDPLVVETDCDDPDISSNMPCCGDPDFWICPSCDWSNGSLEIHHCAGCQTPRPHAPHHNAVGDSVGKATRDNATEIEPLALLLADSDEGMLEEPERAIRVMKESFNENGAVAWSGDEDVTLKAPALTLSLENTKSNNNEVARAPADIENSSSR